MLESDTFTRGEGSHLTWDETFPDGCGLFQDHSNSTRGHKGLLCVSHVTFHPQSHDLKPF